MKETVGCCARLGLAILLLATCAIGSRPALALETTGTLEFLVVDGAGRPLPAARLTLTGTSLLGARTAETGADGRFVFRALQPGTFEVDAEKEGHQKLRREGLVVDAGRTAIVSITLPEGSLQESVTVVAREPLVDPVRTASQFTYDREYLEHVPIGLDARSYVAVLGTAPGVVGNQVRGANVTDNIYLVDGADGSDPYFSSASNGSVASVIFSAIDQLQFQTGAFSPEFGRAPGGVMNVVTKSGGNELSGSVDLRYGSGGMMNEGDHFDPSEISYSRTVGEFGIGGPIVRDKLWYFVAGAYGSSEDAPPESQATTETSTTSWMAKFTWQVQPSHTLTFLGMRTPQVIDNADASPLVSPEATLHREPTNRLASVKYLGVLGPNVVVDAQIGNYRATVSKQPQSGDLTTRCANGFLDGIRTRNACRSEEDARSRNLLTGGVTWQVGKHSLRAGADLQTVEASLDMWRAGGGTDTVAPDASGATVTLLAADWHQPQQGVWGGDIYAGYVQDEWRIHPRVTAQLGLRYSDYSYVADGNRNVLNMDLFEPRVGVAWDPTGDGKHAVKGTWSRFGLASTLEIVHAAGTLDDTVIDYYGNETIGGYFADLGPVPLDLDEDGVIEDRAYLYSVGGPTGVLYANDGNLEAPRTEEWSVSYDRQFGPSIAAGASYVRRRTTEMIEDYYNEGLQTYVIDNVPGLVRHYEGLEVRFRAQYRLGLTQASYVLSETVGNSSYTIWPGVSEEYDFPSTSTNRFGYMNTDTRHAFKLNGFVRLPLAFEIAYGYVYASGYAWTLEENVLPYGTAFPEGRGNERLPHFSQLDLDFSRTFRMGPTDLRLIVSVLNVMNDEAVTAVNTLEGAAGEPIDYQRPRRWQAGLRFNF